MASKLCKPCGYAQVSCNTVCEDCIWAPEITYLCSEGPAPGGLFVVNILGEAEYTPPATGTWEFEVLSYDKSGIVSKPTVQNDGTLSIQTNTNYVKGKTYRVYYRINEVGGVRSSTGFVEFCMQDLCSDCSGGCDPVTGDCAVGDDITESVECGTEYTYDVSDWVYDTYSVVAGGSALITGVSIAAGVLTLNTGSLTPGIHEIFIRIQKGTATKDVSVRLSAQDKCGGEPAGVVCCSCTGATIDFQGGAFEGEGPHLTTTVYTGANVLTYTVEEHDVLQIANPAISSLGLFSFDLVSGVAQPFTTVVKLKVSDGDCEAFTNLLITVDGCKGCEGACGECAGDVVCVYAETHTVEDALCGTIGNTLNLVIGNEIGFEYYVKEYSSGLENVTIDNTGTLSYDVVAGVTDFITPQKVQFRKKCEKIYHDGEVVITICDKCFGVIVPVGKVCNKCTGAITDALPEIRIDGGVIGNIKIEG